jgi:hypothetical protein
MPIARVYDLDLARASDQPTADPRHCKATGANAGLLLAGQADYARPDCLPDSLILGVCR